MTTLKLYALVSTLLSGWLAYHLWQTLIVLDHYDEAALDAYEEKVLRMAAPHPTSGESSRSTI